MVEMPVGGETTMGQNTKGHFMGTSKVYAKGCYNIVGY